MTIGASYSVQQTAQTDVVEHKPNLYYVGAMLGLCSRWSYDIELT